MTELVEEDVLWEALSLRHDIRCMYDVYREFPIPWLRHNFWLFSLESNVETWKDTDNKFHRSSGPAIRAVGGKRILEVWINRNIIHRVSGPAITYGHGQYWYKDGQLHNLSGPAIITTHSPKEYWIDGVKFSPKQYKWEIQRRMRKNKL